MALVIAIVVLIAVVYAYAITVSSRSVTVSGVTVGEVVVNGQTPIRLRLSAGGLSASERAAVVARRLSAMPDLAASEVTVSKVNGQYVVVARNQVLITADNSQALEYSTTPYGLAIAWRDQLRSAISGAPIGAGPSSTLPSTGGGPSVQSKTSVDMSQKAVPILSVGSGLRVGVAVVAGEREQVAQVKAVAQIEGDFHGNARIRALVPVSTENVVSNINRVPGTSVIGVADIRL